jgi:hypothetical protein
MTWLDVLGVVVFVWCSLAVLAGLLFGRAVRRLQAVLDAPPPRTVRAVPRTSESARRAHSTN